MNLIVKCYHYFSLIHQLNGWCWIIKELVYLKEDILDLFRWVANMLISSSIW